MGFKLFVKRGIKHLLDVKNSKGMMYQAVNYSKLIKLNKLTSNEKRIIKERWADIIPNIEDGYLSYEIFKTVDKFDIDYIPREYYHPYIVEALNRKEYMYALSNKAMAYTYFKDLAMPKLVLIAYGGVIYNDNFDVFTIGDAAKYIMALGKKMIIKITTDTGHGHGVKLIKPKDGLESIVNTLTAYKDNYIIQEIVEQSECTMKFNPTSLNTFRIFTLLINGKYSRLGQMLKCGGLGQYVDNATAGSSFVAVSNDGSLANFGRTLDGDIIYELNGYKFAEHKIVNIEKVFDLVEQGHKRISAVGLVGWDIAMDKNNNPLIIEANLFRPGSLSFQFSCGPLFGERTQEVLDYVKTHKRPNQLFY